VWLQSLKKVQKRAKINFFLQKIKKGIKKAEFHADYKSVEKVFEKCIKKLYAKQVWRT
jgi:hypothetical protein